MMKISLSVFALCAACLLISGCGCSKEKTAVDGVSERMKDPVYTNRLVQIRKGQLSAAGRVAQVRNEIAKLGKNPESNPKYVALTNELAKCMAEFEHHRKEAMTTARARILKDATKKGNLKK
jgi:hypothetical protein